MPVGQHVLILVRQRMKKILPVIVLLLSVTATAQHCPWDCSGMILLRTDLSPTEFRQLQAVLVDGKKEPVVDTIYGTGAATYDTCNFLYYDDFLAYRTSRIPVHQWYRIDTVYAFAAGYYVVRFNYCEYRRGNTDLFIRYTEPGKDPGVFKYMTIPLSRRVHLHDYNGPINRRETAEILRSIEPMILVVRREEW